MSDTGTTDDGKRLSPLLLAVCIAMLAAAVAAVFWMSRDAKSAAPAPSSSTVVPAAGVSGVDPDTATADGPAGGDVPAETAEPTDPLLVDPPRTADPDWVPDGQAIPSDKAGQGKQQAEKFMRQYARPAQKDDAQWENRIRPYLATGVLETVQIQPSQVPFSKVTGPATVTAGSGDDLIATVPTDQGNWSLTLTPGPRGYYLVKELPRTADAQGGS